MQPLTDMREALVEQRSARLIERSPEDVAKPLFRARRSAAEGQAIARLVEQFHIAQRQLRTSPQIVDAPMQPSTVAQMDVELDPSREQPTFGFLLPDQRQE